MMHGHPAPPQHMGHPPPPPPHLTHLTSVPPPNVPPQGPRINNNRHHHHHPRVPGAAGAGNHQTLEGPHHMVPLPHQQQQQHGGQKSRHYGGNNGLVAGGVPPKHMGGKSQQSYNSSSGGGGNYRAGGHGVHHSAGGIPVVSAAGNLGTKTRMIPAHEPKPIHNHNAAPPAPVPSNPATVPNVAHHAPPPQPPAESSAPQISGAPIVSSTAPPPSQQPAGTIVTNNAAATGSVPPPPPAITSVPPPSTTPATGTTEDSGSNSQQQMQPMSQLLSSVPENLANTKEKTPMCLVNELARYNKCQHQYRLTGESGPAHKKRFTVTLKLGDEEYTAEGPSIKKAQHSAANEAIAATKYKHPPAKINRIKVGGKTPIGNITPTVELNALAMKRGEPTVYETEQMVPTLPPPPHGNFFTAPPPPNSHYAGGGGYHHRTNGAMYSNPPPPGTVRYGAPAPPNAYNRRNMKPDYHSRGYLYNHHHNMHPVIHPPPESYKVTLHVGERTFLGEGITLQAARHDAAARALEVLKPLTPETSNAAGGNCHDTSIDSDDPNSELKSPISLVHELALKRKMAVQFEVHSEKGPPHMKVFTTICKVGNIVTEGEGNGKKISKKRAAEKMLEELRKLPPTSPEKNVRPPLKPKRKLPLPKKKTRNLIKENGEEDPLDMVNPISRLMQIQQARKEKEPEYTLVEERGMARRREFIMEVLASGKTASGVGPTKKLAKKEAAESLLVMLGYGRSSTGNVSSPNKENQSASANEGGEKHGGRKAFNGGSAGRQIVPGVLQLNSGVSNKSNQPVKEPQVDTTDSIGGESPKPLPSGGPTKTVSASNAAASNVAAPVTTTTTSSLNPDIGRKKEQLMYLAQLLKFEVMFSDFPKGNHGEYLTLVTLSTDPPQLCHGSGASLEESHDEAARGALEILSKIGLDNVKPKGGASSATTDDSKSKK